MKKRLLVTALTLVLGAVALTSVATGSTSNDRDHRLVIGVRVDFTSSTHAEGTFAACCVVNDSGTAQADVTSYVPGENNTATFEATETFEGEDGTFVLALRGTTGPLDSPVHIARGRWRVVGGTGDYAGLRGSGGFTAVTDQVTGALTAINKGAGRS